MDFMKRHKIKLILLVVLILVFIVALIVLLKLLYPDSRKDVYGDRLSGIKDTKISNQMITEVKDKIGSFEFVNDIEFDLKGKLIYFTIEVKADTKVDDSKNLVNNIADLFDSNIHSFYDMQVIVIEDKDESESYPIFAYKHKTSEVFVWTNN